MKSQTAPIAFCDVTVYLVEHTDILAEKPELVNRVATILKTAQVDDHH